MTTLMTPVILSGGAGTRLWPLSRELYPKQLLQLLTSRTLIQETAHRVAGKELFTAPIIICNNEHRFIIAQQLAELGGAPARILIEPIARNTAAAIAIAAETAASPDQLLLILPADHHIADEAAFLAAVKAATPAAVAGYIVTFGIAPTGPETGYGYIKTGAPLAQSPALHHIAAFAEKPARTTAEAYVASGDYLWNSGMFLATAASLKKAFKTYAPDILAGAAAAFASSTHDLDFVRLAEEPMKAMPSLAFDVAVMEKTDNAAVLPCSMGWTDIGTWSALWQVSPQDEKENALIGEVFAEDSTGCYVRSEHQLTAVLGLQNMAVVVTDDAVLVAPRERTQELSALVGRMKAAGRSETKLHTRVYRPWGYYQSLTTGPGFQVKRICVSPGGKLSLQKHHHRSEHWTIVHGTATVTVGEKKLLLSENQGVYIPVGTVHRLENPGRIPLTLIEVQTGSYLGEDDIVRLEDVYARAPASVS